MEKLEDGNSMKTDGDRGCKMPLMDLESHALRTVRVNLLSVKLLLFDNAVWTE